MEQGKSQLKSGTVLNYLNMMLGFLISVFYIPVMLQLLGQNEYGLYKLASSVMSYLGLITLGLGSAIGRYLIKAQVEEGKDAQEKMLGLFMVIFQAIALLTLIVGTVLTLNLGIWYGDSLTDAELVRMKIIVFILVCNTALNFQASPYISVASVYERFIFIQAMNIISNCVLPLVNLLFLFFGFKSIGMAVSSLVVSLIIRCLYIYYVRRRIGVRIQFRGMPLHLLKEIFFFSFWSFIANLVNQLYSVTDTVMIGTVAALGTAGVAVYNVGATFNTLMNTLTVGVSSLLSPRANKMVFSGATAAQLTDFSVRYGRLQEYIAVLVTTGFIAFGKPFINFYTGAAYADAYWVAVTTMIPSLIPLAQSVCLSIIIAQNKQKFRSIVYLGIAVINVIGTWFLMHTSLGIIGAALMTGIATVLGQGFAMNWYYRKKTGLEMRRFWKELGQLYIVPVLLCVLTLVIANWVNFYSASKLFLGIMLYTGLYCVLSWKFIMNEYEKKLFSQLCNKILKRKKNKSHVFQKEIRK